MASKKSKTAPETAEKRPVGRPPAMPGEGRLTNHMVRVAQDIPDLIGELATARGQSRGQVVTILIRQAAEARNRRIAANAAKAAAKEATPAS
jgi:hypothetical protein